MLLFVLWSSFLVLWPSQGAMEGNKQDVCQGDKVMEELHVLDFVNSALHEDFIELTDVRETFICLLYPKNLLNCSWSFLTLEKDMQLSVSISVCHDTTTVRTLNQSSVERVGSRSLNLEQHEELHVILQFNMTHYDKYRVYTYSYDKDTLEVVSPPSNISAAFKDGDLLVKWAESNPMCFEYRVDLGNQEPPKKLKSQLFYTEVSADPTFTYRVRMKRRKLDSCIGSQWSEWSPTVSVDPSAEPDKLNTLSIISISFGIPMILLALLLFQRVSKLLFPPIPRPAPKYIYYLEENYPFNFSPPVQPSKAEEEITKVTEEEENPLGHFKSNMGRTLSNLTQGQ
ncbi:granulocyte-macrophage colony-stimulating factor receptor subunit alpha-like [Platichthys flesus]|uniref:granulocyte-macrophage colony-stimulating factor receptor subunit alpha-like n=1 Tax=Platichthys flesus TaxID=8260 RepID=UPI002DBCEA66|nr:granulocyte-macrophage colony-stimulating factor receptor subunit alpha-like [Platichthys flesus]